MVTWWGMARKRWNLPDLLYHIPNEGERDGAAAGWYARMGLKPGVPDLCLPVARRGFHGLYIELKALKGGRLERKQIAWLESLQAQGYFAVVCQGAESAIKMITGYLEESCQNK